MSIGGAKLLVLAIHRDLVDRFGGEPGLGDGLLDSALAQAEATFGDELLHPGVYEQAAAYLFHLCANHPFIDGNKRVAFATMDTFLRRNGYSLTLSDEEAYELAMNVARGEISKAEIAETLRARQLTGPVRVDPHERGGAPTRCRPTRVERPRGRRPHPPAGEHPQHVERRRHPARLGPRRQLSAPGRLLQRPWKRPRCSTHGTSWRSNERIVPRSCSANGPPHTSAAAIRTTVENGPLTSEPSCRTSRWSTSLAWRNRATQTNKSPSATATDGDRTGAHRTKA